MGWLKRWWWRRRYPPVPYRGRIVEWYNLDAKGRVIEREDT